MVELCWPHLTIVSAVVRPSVLCTHLTYFPTYQNIALICNRFVSSYSISTELFRQLNKMSLLEWVMCDGLFAVCDLCVYSVAAWRHWLRHAAVATWRPCEFCWSRVMHVRVPTMAIVCSHWLHQLATTSFVRFMFHQLACMAGIVFTQHDIHCPREQLAPYQLPPYRGLSLQLYTTWSSHLCIIAQRQWELKLGE